MRKNQFQKVAVICLVIDAVTIAIVLVFRKNIPPLVPLFYGLPVSSDQLIASWRLIIPPLISILLLVIDFGITKVAHDAFLTKIMTGFIIILTALSIITVVEIIHLVGVFS